jgi:hypothetical protein
MFATAFSFREAAHDEFLLRSLKVEHVLLDQSMAILSFLSPHRQCAFRHTLKRIKDRTNKPIFASPLCYPLVMAVPDPIDERMDEGCGCLVIESEDWIEDAPLCFIWLQTQRDLC